MWTNKWLRHKKQLDHNKASNTERDKRSVDDKKQQVDRGERERRTAGDGGTTTERKHDTDS